MFDVSGLRVAITRGDSGLLTLKPRGDHVFGAQDRAVFTIRRPGGGALMEAVYTPEADGTVQVALESAQTARWRPDAYEWDVRYVLDARTDERGGVIGGREVATPMHPAPFVVLRAVGCVNEE